MWIKENHVYMLVKNNSQLKMQITNNCTCNIHAIAMMTSYNLTVTKTKILMNVVALLPEWTYVGFPDWIYQIRLIEMLGKKLQDTHDQGLNWKQNQLCVVPVIYT